jgi:hypothetical protein
MRQPLGRCLITGFAGFCEVWFTSVRPRAVGPETITGLETMPTLFRFIVFLGVVGGLVYVGTFSLANFFKPQPREIIVTVPSSKFVKQP